MVKYLVETAKADVSARDNDGNTALMWAARNGHSDIEKYLTGIEECLKGCIQKRTLAEIYLCWCW